ncbi:MAG: hypothetical protein ABEH47_05800 [Haloferacaceae archaeon]
MDDSTALLVGGWLQGVGAGTVLGLVAPVGGRAVYAAAGVALVAAVGGYCLERTGR